jgi:hypothetical protein
MNKKLIASILILILGTTVSAKMKKDDIVCIKKIMQSFQDGYSSAFYQMEREFNTQGWKEKPIQFKKYIVVVNMDELTQAQVFLYKHFATSIGRTAITIVDDLLVMGSANRKVDANDLKEKLNKGYLNSFKHKTYIMNNVENKTYIAAPIVYKAIFDKIKKEIQDEARVKVLVIEKPAKKIYIKAPVKKEVKKQKVQVKKQKKVTPKKVIKKQKTKPVRYSLLSFEVQALGVEKGHEKEIKDGLKEDYIISRGFIKGKTVRIEKIFVSDDNVQYGKIRGKDLFIDMESIKKDK